MTALIQIGPEICGDFAASSRLEWLETNGVGGFASASVSGAHTRRSHGLLAASAGAPDRRILLLSKLEETLTIGTRSWELSANVFTGSIHPRGFELLRDFRIDPFPIFTYANEHFELHKTILAVHGENTILVRYELLKPSEEAHLEVRPLIAAREIAALTFENSTLRTSPSEAGNRLILHPYPELPPFQLAHNGVRVDLRKLWYRGFEYSDDQGYQSPSVEDLFNACSIHFELSSQRISWILASTRIAPVFEETADGLFELETIRREELAFARRQPAETPLEKCLLRAADQFLVREPDGRLGVLESYPVGRPDRLKTLVAMTGLTLVTGRWREARKILRAAAQDARDAQPDEDPTSGLWLIHCADRYLRFTGDLDTVRDSLYDTLKKIIEAFPGGSASGMRLEDDGLLQCESSSRGRSGKTVELQALWYNALAVMTFLSQNIEGSKASHFYSSLARLCRKSFLDSFWNPKEECLHDRIVGISPDSSIRAYQLFAAGLPGSMLSRQHQQMVVRRIERDLLLPTGIRMEAGDSAVENRAPTWWIGLYVTAWVHAFGRSDQTRDDLRLLLEPYWQHLLRAGLGTVSEQPDSTGHHAAPASATAVAELLRVYYEEIAGRK